MSKSSSSISESNLRSLDSSNDLMCQQKVDPKDSESIWSLSLLTPIYILAGFIVFLRYLSLSFYDLAVIQSKNDKYIDPFKSVWIEVPIAFTILYLGTVYFGRKYMNNRKEFQIAPYVFIYNFYQCVLNIWTVYAMYEEVYINPHFTNLWGNVAQNNIGGYRISFLVWIHYNNKFVELLDTLWMILKKKDKQISFLHCYHHVLLIWSWFMVLKYESGGDSYFGASVNSFIHIIMYGYYTLALLKIPCPWKKWITNCQMLQFILCFSHACYVYYKGNMPVELPLMQAFVMLNMLYLFSKFYSANYGKTRIIEKKDN